MDSEDRSSTPEHIKAAFTRIISDGAIPLKSRKNYRAAYSKYVLWKEKNAIPATSNSESVIGCFINSLVGSIVPTYLWLTSSMIRSHILVDTGIMVKTPLVNATIKRLCDGYIPKQAAVLTKEQFGQFLVKESDTFLSQKAIIAIGLSGALRKCEIYNMKFGDVKQLEGTFLISIPKSKTNTTGSFAVTSPKDAASPLNYYNFLERYHRLRVAIGTASDQPYIMQVRFGKCTRQRVGQNSIAKVPQIVANSLGLENPKSYTGHSFRRSSTTALAESGADILTIQRHGRWQSSTVAERYMSESVFHRVGVAQRICYEAQTSTSHTEANITTSQVVVGPTALADSVPHVSPFAINLGNNNTFTGNITFICKE